MRLIRLFIFLFPALLFGQVIRVTPSQIGDYGGGAGAFMRSTGTFAEWISASAARAAIFPTSTSNYTLRGTGSDWTASDRIENDGSDVWLKNRVRVGPNAPHAPSSRLSIEVAGYQGMSLVQPGYAHGVTNSLDTDVMGFWGQYGSFGTNYFIALTKLASFPAFLFQGINTISPTEGVFRFEASKKSGSSGVALSATEPAFDITSGGGLLARVMGNGDFGIGGVTPSAKLDVNGAIRLRTLTTTNQLLRADASGNLSQTLPAISTSGFLTTLDFSSNTLKFKTTDEIRDEVGASNHLHRKLTDGTIRRPQLVASPAAPQQGSEHFDALTVSPAWFESSSAGGIRHAASVEKNIQGFGPLALGASFTVGANPRNYCQIADANTSAITVTLDLGMEIGQTYRIPLRRNGTNTVTFTVPSGSMLDAGASSLNDTPFTAAAHRVIFVVRESDTLYSLFQSGN